MKFVKGIFFKTKDEFDSEFISCPIKDFKRDLYMNIRILLRIIFFVPFFYFVGESLYLISHTLYDIINYFIMFFCYFVVFFCLLQIVNEFIRVIVLWDIKHIVIKLLHRKRLITVSSSKVLSKIHYFFTNLIPFLLTTIICVLLIEKFEIKIIGYSLLASNLVLCTENIINCIIILFAKDPIMTYEISNSYSYVDTSEIIVDDLTDTVSKIEENTESLNLHE